MRHLAGVQYHSDWPPAPPLPSAHLCGFTSAASHQLCLTSCLDDMNYYVSLWEESWDGEGQRDDNNTSLLRRLLDQVLTGLLPVKGSISCLWWVSVKLPAVTDVYE